MEEGEDKHRTRWGLRAEAAESSGVEDRGTLGGLQAGLQICSVAALDGLARSVPMRPECGQARLVRWVSILPGSLSAA